SRPQVCHRLTQERPRGGGFVPGPLALLLGGVQMKTTGTVALVLALLRINMGAGRGGESKPAAKEGREGRLRAAGLQREALEKKHQAVEKAAKGGADIEQTIAALQKALADMDGSLSAEKTALGALKETTAKLRQMANSILAREDSFAEAVANYRQEL